MRSVGSIIVGISTYRYGTLNLPLLRYASQDASGFEAYLRACWPKIEDIELIQIDERNSTLDSLSGAFSSVRDRGPFDLFILFLSGHGFVEGDQVGFVMQPSTDSSSLCLLTPGLLDEFLASLEAKRVILILDCCYAEGVTRRMSFFLGLGGSDARLYIASSREDQLTWEDERVGHGIFTAHLLDLLMTGNSLLLKGIRDALELDGELFPVLCEQVPLYVLENKKEQQEPVKGGVSMRPVTLPVARAARRIKERSAFGTAIRLLRRIVGQTIAAVVLFCFWAYVLTYYAQADRNGNVRLHHGTRWLAPLVGFLPSVRVDTGITASDLSSEPADRYAIQSGDTWGFWTQESPQGYRGWYGAPFVQASTLRRPQDMISSQELERRDPVID